MDAPVGLGPRGARLWDDVCEVIDPDPMQRELLLEACRISDRLDKLDRELNGRDFSRVARDDDGDQVLKIDGALAAASREANVLKQLLVALRLPDAKTGRKPQYRGPRGVQQPSMVTSLTDRLRESG
jgi:hypothetical protein